MLGQLKMIRLVKSKTKIKRTESPMHAARLKKYLSLFLAEAIFIESSSALNLILSVDDICYKTITSIL